MKRVISALSALLVLVGSVSAQQNYSPQKPMTEVVNAQVGEFNKSATWRVPMIAWGADLQTIYGNGSDAKTQPGSLFAEAGLNVELFREDSFPNQVAAYMKGETNFVRGTIGMINSALEVTNADQRTEMVPIYLLSRSVGGDALVVKDSIKTLKDMDDVTVALQAYGPHPDLLMTALQTATLGINDVKIKWCPDLFQVDENSWSPGRALAEDPTIDAAFVIIPEALALTSNGTVGSGAEGSIKGARILYSTKTATNVIFDCIAVRRDFLEAEKEKVQAFVGALLKATEEVTAVLKDKDSAKAKQLVKVSAGLLLDDSSATEDMYAMATTDCAHAGWNGNVKFFASQDNRNLSNVSKGVQGDFVTLGLLSRQQELSLPGWNYKNLATGLDNADLTALSKEGVAPVAAFKKEEVARIVNKRQQQRNLGEGELYSFDIYFAANQQSFSAEQYEQEFNKVMELVSIYGGAILTIEGHADPSNYLVKKLREKAPVMVLNKVQQSSRNLSYQRSSAVMQSIIGYGKQKGIAIDESQFGLLGHGVVHPSFALGKDGDITKDAYPKSQQEKDASRHVTFRLIQVEAESEAFEPLF